MIKLFIACLFLLGCPACGGKSYETVPYKYEFKCQKFSENVTWLGVSMNRCENEEVVCYIGSDGRFWCYKK